MKTHSWRRASPPTNSAGPMLLAGLTDVPSIGIPMRWTSVRARPMTRPATNGVARTSRHGKDHEHEQEGEDDFGHKRTACVRMDHRMGPVPVGAKPDRPGVVTRRRVEDTEQCRRPSDPSHNLCDPVADSVRQRYATCCQKPNSDGWVYMAPRDGAYRVNEHEQYQAESERRHYNPCGLACSRHFEAKSQCRSTNSKKHKQRRA